jgi:hypothetical protein
MLHKAEIVEDNPWSRLKNKTENSAVHCKVSQMAEKLKIIKHCKS